MPARSSVTEEPAWLLCRRADRNPERRLADGGRRPRHGLPAGGLVVTGNFRAVLSDLGGTLTRSDGFMEANARALCRLASLYENPAGRARATRALQSAFARVGLQYLARPFYLHRDLFATVAAAALRELGVEPTLALLSAYDEMMAAAICEGRAIARRRARDAARAALARAAPRPREQRARGPALAPGAQHGSGVAVRFAALQ